RPRHRAQPLSLLHRRAPKERRPAPDSIRANAAAHSRHRNREVRDRAGQHRAAGWPHPSDPARRFRPHARDSQPTPERRVADAESALRHRSLTQPASRGRFRGQSHRLTEGQTNGKTRAAALSISHDDLPRVRFDQLTRDRKSQAKPAWARARTAIKFFKYLVLFARGKTRPMIGNGNNKHRIIARRAEIDWQVAMPNGIREQSAQCLLNQTRVDENG